MSEHSVSFLIKVNDSKNTLNLRLLIEGMCNGELGAYIEERVECFGEQAENLAEQMLDMWERNAGPPEFFNFKHKNNTFGFLMTTGSSVVEDADVLKNLLSACGASISTTEHFLVDTD